MLDGCYKAIGVCSNTEEPIVDINVWYQGELKRRLEEGGTSGSGHSLNKILILRTLWLLRKFAFKISNELFDEVLIGIFKCVANEDLVIGLQAIVTLHSFILIRQSKLQQLSTPNSDLPFPEIVKQCFNVLPKLKETENSWFSLFRFTLLFFLFLLFSLAFPPPTHLSG